MPEVNTGITDVTDFSNPAHCLSLPENPSYPVDIFYVYPTSWHKVDQAEPNYCPFDHPGLLKGAAFAFSKQATVFETVGNIYALFYRQVDSLYAMSLPADQRKQCQ